MILFIVSSKHSICNFSLDALLFLQYGLSKATFSLRKVSHEQRVNGQVEGCSIEQRKVAKSAQILSYSFPSTCVQISQMCYRILEIYHLFMVQLGSMKIFPFHKIIMGIIVRISHEHVNLCVPNPMLLVYMSSSQLLISYSPKEE